jgi:periplasmic divalent cation tolerance protein
MLLVFTTFSDGESAAPVVRQLLEEKLIACATILPGARSLYAWEGKIQDTTEVLVLLKTLGPLYAKLEKRLTQLHPYDTPEIVALEAGAVAKPYAAWVAANLAAP